MRRPATAPRPEESDEPSIGARPRDSGSLLSWSLGVPMPSARRLLPVLGFCLAAMVAPAPPLSADESSGVVPPPPGVPPAAGQAGVDRFVPNLKPRLEVRRLEGAIEIDGDLDDSGWKTAAVAGNFTEFRPDNKERPDRDTEVRIAYDAGNLYIAFRCDDDPRTIRASLRDRDQIWQDDYVGILLDTFRDNTAYEIFLNPLGIQGDLKLMAGGNEDMGLDLVLHSRGKITETGYQVELAIPFSSIRFPEAPEQSWGATFWRNRPRDDRENYSWASLDRGEPCFPCTFGELTGISGIRRGTSLALLPGVTSSQTSFRSDPGNPDSPFTSDDAGVDLSLNARYALGSDLSASIALNPDFSQIESDAGQIDVNSTFALFNEERRPFFGEASEMYQSPLQAIYTRQINDPGVAARLTGRVGRVALAYIGAQDEHSPVMVPLEEQTLLAATPLKSFSNILRARMALGKESSLGALLTDRRLMDGGTNSVGGIDGRFRIHRNYRIEGQLLVSHTRERTDDALTGDLGAEGVSFSDGRHTAAMDGESFDGTALSAQFIRDGDVWNANVWHEAFSPAFRSDNGFITGNSTRTVGAHSSLHSRPHRRFLREFVVSGNVARTWNWEGQEKEGFFRPQVEIGLPRQTWIWAARRFFGHERYRDVLFTGIERYNVGVGSDWNRWLSFNVDVVWGDMVARGTEVPVLGTGTNYSARITLRPLAQLLFEPRLTFADLFHPERDAGGDRAEIYSGYILRTRLQYQFTRELFLRTIVEYDDFSRSLQVDPLLSYKLNPYTVAFLGSSHNLLDFDEATTPGHAGFSENARTFFLKFQYLMQI